jgi:hypothetical protein
MMMPKVFISHANSDQEIIEREIIRPLDEHNITYWYCKHAIEAGDRWRESLHQGLKNSEWFMLVMSPRSAESPYVRDELGWALTHRRGKLLPVLIETCDMRRFDFSLELIQHRDFRTNKEQARQSLIRILLSSSAALAPLGQHRSDLVGTFKGVQSLGNRKRTNIGTTITDFRTDGTLHSVYHPEGFFGRIVSLLSTDVEGIWWVSANKVLTQVTGSNGVFGALLSDEMFRKELKPEENLDSFTIIDSNTLRHDNSQDLLFRIRD